MLQTRFGFVSANFNPKEITDFLPSHYQTLINGEKLTLTGKLLSNEATLTINYGYGINNITQSKKFVLKKSESVGINEIVPRLWAQRKVIDLCQLPQDNTEELLTIGRQFKLVTPGM